MAKILDGKIFAKNLRDELKGIVSTLREEYGNVPGLAVVLVAVSYTHLTLPTTPYV